MYGIVFSLPTHWFVFPGWDEGCMTMSEGEIAKLTIPSHKGYGASGFSSWGYPFNFEKSLLHYV